MARTENNRTLITPKGARISYRESGRGTPLVLLHGIGSAARSWRHQLDSLGDRYRVIAWDAPGYGESSPLAPARPVADDYADALADFLDALQVDRFHLVGHSLGCIIAARYACLHPVRILSLTLASVAAGHACLPDEERARLLEARVSDVTTLGPRAMAEKRGPRLLGRRPDEAVKRAVVDTMAAVRPDGYAQAAHMLSGADTRADVHALASSLRVQIVYGDADVITPPEQNLTVAQARPGIATHVLPDAGHALYLEQPDAFNALVRAFTGAGQTA